MKFNSSDDRKRGQVGIGTLIVFIAMVLVAAIAAGVLINTAGFLQERGQQAGEESGEQVTNRIQLQNAWSNDTDGGIGDIYITGSLAPGSETVNLSSATIQWIGPDNAQTLTHADSASASNFATTLVQNVGGGSGVLNDPGDVAQFKLNASAIGSGLSAGSTAEVRLTTASNGESTIVLNAPRTLSANVVTL